MALANPCITIKAKATHHALFLIILACALFIVTLSLSQYYWHAYRINIIFLYLLTLLIMLTGLFKYSEPKFSLYLQPDGLRYVHRHGVWYMHWHQVKNINLISDASILSKRNLPYIGLQLHDIDILAEQISPRLANKLIHEQQPLLSYAIVNQLISFEQAQLNFNPFVLNTGKILHGPLAAFMYHCQVLHIALGYHLYIPEQSTDRELADFCKLLKQCRNYALLHYAKNKSTLNSSNPRKIEGN